jgi:hypothetical protein
MRPQFFLLQLNNKMVPKNFFFIFFIFFICSIDAATLTISPPHLNFEGKVGDEICNNIKIKVNGTENMTGKIKWAKEGYFERILHEHNLDSEELNLKINFPEKVKVDGSEEIEICLRGKKSGKYHGVLLYRIQDKPLQIGIWTNVSLEGNDFIKMTGNFVNAEGESNNLLIFPIILLIIFFVLLIWYKKKIS